MANVVHIVIDDSTNKVITGVHEYNRDGGGTLIIPAGTSFPGTPQPGELFWRTDENKLYRRNSSGTAWEAVSAAVVAHATSHQNGGSDEVATATAAADAIPKAGGTGKLSIGWFPTGSTDQTVCIGNDSRLSDARTPTAHASTHNAGGSDALAIDAAAGTGSLRTLGTSATAACAGNDSRLSNARTPTAHATSHQPGGSDAMAVDAAAGTGSLRTIGTGALQACAGNDSRLSDARIPTGSASGDLGGSYPGPSVVDLTITGEAQGDLLYFNGTNWVRLPAGTSGYYLKTQGASANPTWSAVTGTGDVVGPASSVDNTVVRFDGTTGKLIQGGTNAPQYDDSGNLWLRAASELRFYDSDNSNYVGFEAPALSANTVYVLPSADGTAQQHQVTDGSANLSWVSHYVNSGTSEAESSTTSGTYQTKLTVTQTYTSGVRYRIDYQFEIGATGDADADYRVTVGGTTVMEGIFRNYPYATRYMAVSGFYFSTTLSGSVSTLVQYNMGYGGTAYIRRARVLVARVD